MAQKIYRTTNEAGIPQSPPPRDISLGHLKSEAEIKAQTIELKRRKKKKKK